MMRHFLPLMLCFCGVFFISIQAFADNLNLIVDKNISFIVTGEIAVPLACFEDSNGAVTVAITGGSFPFTFAWNTVPIQTDSIAINLSAGTYSVVVTDNIGCTSTIDVELTTPTELTSEITISTAALCNGSSDGTATAAGSGGTPSYTYLWDANANNQTTAMATGLAAGNYSVTVFDANSCESISTVTIVEPAALTSSAVATAENCNGTSDDGTITVTATGGTAPYDYSIDGNLTSQTENVFTGLAGSETGMTYTIDITDDNGCSSQTTATVFEPTELTSEITISTAALCNGSSDGTATAAGSGGTPSYTYLWDANANNQTTAMATGLAAGNYSVTVFDANSCESISTVTIVEPAALTSSAVATAENCNGTSDDGTITVTATGGTAPYDYSIDGNLTSQTENVFTGLAGSETGMTYTIDITDDNGCSSQTTATVFEPTELTSEITISTAALCNSSSDGTATAAGSGGTPSYTYLWDANANNQTTAMATGLAAGNYSVTVFDANSCESILTVTIVEPAALTSSAVATAENCNGTSDDGTITVTATGGTAPYDYSIDGNLTSQTENVFTGLAGSETGMTYTIDITDDNGCSSQTTATVFEPTAIDATAVVSNVSCNGGSDGSVSASALGGTGVYNYEWNDGQMTQTATGLSAGTYIVTVTDGNDCTVTVNNIVVTQPDELILSCSQQQPTTSVGGNDGIGQVNIQGGTSPFTVDYGTGTLSNQTTGDVSINNLSAGNYSVTVTDANNCTKTCSFIINDPGCDLMVSATATDQTCIENANITLTPTNGIPPYNYQWSNGTNSDSGNGEFIANVTGNATYQITLTDNIGCVATTSIFVNENTTSPTVNIFPNNPVINCNMTSVNLVASGSANVTYLWNTGADMNSITVTAQGTYIVTVTDNSNGCETTMSIFVAEDNTEPDASATGGEITCTNPSVTLMGSSTTSGVLFSWTGPNGFTSNEQSPTVNQEGEYMLTVTDGGNGCTTTATAMVTLDGNVPTASAVGGTITCTSSSITLMGSSTTSGVSFSWIGPNGFTSNNQNPTITQAGEYTLTVTGSGNGCTATAIAVVTLNTAAPTASAVGGTITCTSSSITLMGSSTTSGVSFSWTGPNGFTSNNQNPTITQAGEYTLTVTDSGNGCTATAIAVVTLNTAAPTASAVGGTITCTSSSITLMGSSTTSGVSFSWTGPNGFTSNNQNPTIAQAGEYTLTVTDSGNGCTATAIAMVTLDTAAPTANAVGETITCTSPSVTLMGSSTTSNVSFSWAGPNGFSSIEQNPTVAQSGNYILTVISINGCTSTATAVVSSNADTPIVTTMLSSPSVLTCNNLNVTINANATTDDFNYSWSGPNGFFLEQQNITVSNPGTYIVTVTNNNNGCTNTAMEVITEDKTAPEANAPATLSFCEGSSGTLMGSSPTAGVDYTWTKDNVTIGEVANVNVTTGGVYVLTVSNPVNGCESTATTQVTVNDNPTIVDFSFSESSGTPDNGQICNGESVTIMANANATGQGNLMYSWNNGMNVNPITVSPTVNTPYQVTVTDENGCMNSDNTNVIVFSLPNAIIEVTDDSGINNNDGIACMNDNPISLDGSNSNGITSIDEYSWFPGGMNSSNISISTATVQSTIYVLIVTDANGCTDSQSKNITIHPLPNTQIALDENSGIDDDDGKVCGGDDIVLTASNGSSYLWNTNSTNNSISQINALPGDYTYSVTATDSNNCKKSASIDIEVNNIPIVSISSPIGNPTVDGLVYFSEESQMGDGNLSSWTWDFGQNSDPDTSFEIPPHPDNIAVSYSQTGQKVICVDLIDTNGCHQKDSRQLNILDDNSCGITNVSFNSAGLCVGTLVDLNASFQLSQGATAVNSWNWNFDGGTVVSGGNTSNPIIYFSNAGTYNLTVSFIDNDPVNPCITEDYPFSITINAIPSITNFTGVSPICEGEDTELQIEFASDSESYDVNFSSLPSQMSISNTNPQGYFSLGVSPNQTTNYQITSLTNTLTQCVNNNPINNMATVVVNSRPIIEVLSTECSADNTTYTVIANITNGTPDYIVNGINIGTGPTYELVGIESGSQYNISVSDSNECSAESIETGVVNCGDCSAVEAVSLSTDVINSCIGDNFTITEIPNTIGINADWVITYVLHEGAGESILNQIEAVNVGNNFNLPPDFSYNSSIVPNQTYYISAIISNNLNGMPDPNNPCYRVVPGQPIIFRKIPNLINLSAQPSNICAGDSIFLSFNIDASGNSSEVEWMINEVIQQDVLSIPTDLDFTFGIPFDSSWGDEVTFTITQITDTDYNSCINNAPASVSVNINQLPEVNYSYTEPCEGGNLILNATTGLNAYEWQFNENVISNQSQLLLTEVNQGNEGNYTLIATDSNGCSAEFQDSVTITTPPQPMISGNANPCLNEFNSIYDVDFLTGSTYEWTVNGGTIIGDSTENEVAVYWPNTGPGEVVLTQDATPNTPNDGCEGSTSFLVEVSTDLAPDTTEVILFYTINNGMKSDYFLVAQDSASCYRWGDANGDFSTNATSRSYYLVDFQNSNPTLDGYYVKLWNGDCNDENACKTQSFYRENEFPLPAPERELSVKLFPNPAADFVSVEIETIKENGIFSLVIFDVSGRKTREEQLVISNGKLLQNIDLQELTNGFYMIVIQDTQEGQSWQKPLIIQR